MKVESDVRHIWAIVSDNVFIKCIVQYTFFACFIDQTNNDQTIIVNSSQMVFNMSAESCMTFGKNLNEEKR